MTHALNRRGFLAASTLLMAAAACAGVSSLSRAASVPILAIDGAVKLPDPGGEISYGIDELKALPQTTVTTENPWDNGRMTYQGVQLAQLLDAVGGTGTSVRVHALNDYVAEIPVEELRKYPIILAYLRNGELMPVKDRGPLFVVYPFSDHKELWNEISFSRSVWQVDRITVK